MDLKQSFHACFSIFSFSLVLMSRRSRKNTAEYNVNRAPMTLVEILAAATNEVDEVDEGGVIPVRCLECAHQWSESTQNDLNGGASSGRVV